MLGCREGRRHVVAGGNAILHEIEDEIFFGAVVVLAVDVLAIADADVVGRVDGILGGTRTPAQQDVLVVGAVENLVEIVPGLHSGEGVGRRLGSCLGRQRHDDRNVVLDGNGEGTRSGTGGLVAIGIGGHDHRREVDRRHAADGGAQQGAGIAAAGDMVKLILQVEIPRTVGIDGQREDGVGAGRGRQHAAGHVVDQLDAMRIKHRQTAGRGIEAEGQRRVGTGVEQGAQRTQRAGGLVAGRCLAGIRNAVGGIAVRRRHSVFGNRRLDAGAADNSCRSIIFECDHTGPTAKIDLGGRDVMVAIRYRVDRLQHVAGQIQRFVGVGGVRVIQRLELRQRDIAVGGIDRNREGKHATGSADASFNHPTIVHQHDLVCRVMHRARKVEAGLPTAGDLQRERRRRALFILSCRRTRGVEQRRAQNRHLAQAGGAALGLARVLPEGLVDDDRRAGLQRQRCRRTIVFEGNHAGPTTKIDAGAGNVLVAIGHRVDGLQDTHGQEQCLVIARTGRRMVQRLVLRQRDIAARWIDRHGKGERAAGAADATFDDTAVVDQKDLVGRAALAGQEQTGVAAGGHFQRERRRCTFLVLTGQGAGRVEQRRAQNRDLAEGSNRLRLRSAVLAQALVNDDRCLAGQGQHSRRTIVLERDHAGPTAKVDAGAGNVVVAIGHRVDGFQDAGGQEQRLVVARARRRMVQRLVLRQRDIAARWIDRHGKGERAAGAADATFDDTAVVDQKDLVGRATLAGQEKTGMAAGCNLQRERRRCTFLVLPGQRAGRVEQRCTQNRDLAEGPNRLRLRGAVLAQALIDNDRCLAGQCQHGRRTIVLEGDHAPLATKIHRRRSDILVAIGHRVDGLQRTRGQEQCFIIARARRRMVQRLVLRQHHIAGRGIDRHGKGEGAASATDAAFDHAAIVDQKDLVGRAALAGQEQTGVATCGNFKREGLRRTCAVGTDRRTRRVEQRGAWNHHPAKCSGRLGLRPAVLAETLVDKDRCAFPQHECCDGNVIANGNDNAADRRREGIAVLVRHLDQAGQVDAQVGFDISRTVDVIDLAQQGECQRTGRRQLDGEDGNAAGRAGDGVTVRRNDVGNRGAVARQAETCQLCQRAGDEMIRTQPIRAGVDDGRKLDMADGLLAEIIFAATAGIRICRCQAVFVDAKNALAGADECRAVILDGDRHVGGGAAAFAVGGGDRHGKGQVVFRARTRIVRMIDRAEKLDGVAVTGRCDRDDRNTVHRADQLGGALSGPDQRHAAGG